MPESFVNVTEGSGKKLHTNQRTIGANTVEDEYVLLGEPALGYYNFPSGAAVSLGTANDHVFEIMAGSTLNVYVRRIQVFQSAAATTAAFALFNLFVLTTAGTGGTAISQAKYDAGDGAAGATLMTLPTAKGTETSRVWSGTALLTQTVPVGGGDPLLLDIDFDRLHGKAFRIAAGTANGLALKNLAAYAAATVYFNVFFSEANF